jgi:phage baseplate assembly protein W|tara:strand:- start:1550 stop:1957 length:408 start_codon:yes stop_codon:yes gene_type:complete
MPLIQSTKRINPLDLNNNARIGVAFPLNDVNMTSGTLTTKEQLKANFLNLLLTVPGERLNHPTYGVGLKGQLFENSIDEVTLQENINGQLIFWIPEIVITNISLKQDIDQYRVSLTLTYLVTLDETEDSIQINYS